MRIARFLFPLVLIPLLAPRLGSAGPVNINSADAATLARELKGIGLKRAQSIVEYRSKHGPFKSPDELALVKGIGQKAIEKNRADIRLATSPDRSPEKNRLAAPAPASR